MPFKKKVYCTSSRYFLNVFNTIYGIQQSIYVHKHCLKFKKENVLLQAFLLEYYC